MEKLKRAKILPLLILMLVFSGFLVIQTAFNNFKLVAGPSTLESDKASLYDNIFKNMSFKDVSGIDFVLSKSKSKIIIINFWASWCLPCMEEIPSLIKLKSKFSENDLAIFGINEDSDDQLKSIDKIVKKLGINFSVIADSDSKIINSFNISNIPQTLVFKDGKLIEIIAGEKDFSSIEFIENLKKSLGR